MMAYYYMMEVMAHDAGDGLLLHHDGSGGLEQTGSGTGQQIKHTQHFKIWGEKKALS